MGKVKLKKRIDLEEEQTRLNNVHEMMDYGFNDTHCHNCKVSNADIEGYLMQCGRCKLAYYCGVDCFNMHLPEHMKFCETNEIMKQPERRRADVPGRQQSEAKNHHHHHHHTPHEKQKRSHMSYDRDYDDSDSDEEEVKLKKRDFFLGFNSDSSDSDSSVSLSVAESENEDWETESEEEEEQVELSDDDTVIEVEVYTVEECTDRKKSAGSVEGDDDDYEDEEDEESEEVRMRRGRVVSEEVEEEGGRVVRRYENGTFEFLPESPRHEREKVHLRHVERPEKDKRASLGGDGSKANFDQWNPGGRDGSAKQKDDEEYWEECRIRRGRVVSEEVEEEGGRVVRRYEDGSFAFLPEMPHCEREKVHLRRTEQPQEGMPASLGGPRDGSEKYVDQRKPGGRDGSAKQKDDEEYEEECRMRRGRVVSEEVEEEGGRVVRRYENGTFEFLPESPRHEREKVHLRRTERLKQDTHASLGGPTDGSEEYVDQRKPGGRDGSAKQKDDEEYWEECRIRRGRVVSEEVEEEGGMVVRRYENGKFEFVPVQPRFEREKVDLRRVEPGEMSPNKSRDFKVEPEWTSSPLRTTSKGKRLLGSLRKSDNEANMFDGMRSISEDLDFGTLLESPTQERESVNLREVQTMQGGKDFACKPEWSRKAPLRTTSKGALLKKQGSVRSKRGQRLGASGGEGTDFLRSVPLRTTSKGQKARTVGNLAKPVTNIRVTVENGQINWEKPEWSKKAPLRTTSKGALLKKQGSVRIKRGGSLVPDKDMDSCPSREAPLRTTSKGMKLKRQGSVRVKRVNSREGAESAEESLDSPADRLAQLM